MLTCQNLSLSNNIGNIFSNLSFSILPGSLLAITGRNGCGKTSLLKMILGLLEYKNGNIFWNKINVYDNILLFRQNICYIGHKNALQDDLTVLENLKFWCNFRGEPELLNPAIKYFMLNDILNIKVSLLSKELKRRIELSKLLLYKTNLWLLDEPEINLDSLSKDLLNTLIKIRVKEGGIVLVTTHNFDSIKKEFRLNLEDFKN